MKKIVGSALAAAVLALFATQLHVAPLTGELSAQRHGPDAAGAGVDIPASFEDTFHVADLPSSGLLTTVGPQLSFYNSRLDGGTIDQPDSLSEPTINKDWLGSDLDFGGKLFSGDYSHLMTALNFGRGGSDLGVIASPNPMGNLTPSANRLPASSINAPDSGSGSEPGTSEPGPSNPGPLDPGPAPVNPPTQAVPVPEPSTSALLGIALVLSLTTLGRRKRV